ncbi:hypothetical protein C8J57DRAFT_618875 [Mycena rebaudengoi]|nr:hypothetical protein C8J57DRAFT_618875 [Mycena rebaudengoi]
MHWWRTFEIWPGLRRSISCKQLTPSADSYRLRQHTRVVQPPTLNDTVDTWAELEKLHASGRAPAISVSNFSVKTLEELLQTAKLCRP